MRNSVLFGVLFAFGAVACSDGASIGETTLTTSGPDESTIGQPAVVAGQRDRQGRDGLLPVGGPEVSGFSYDDSPSAIWVGHVEGLFVVEVSQSATSEGSCLMLVGALTSNPLSEDFVASGFQAPEMSVVVNGEQIRTAFDECDTSSTEAAGYGWILDAEVLVGTAYPFYAQVFLEGDSLAGLEAIIIGDPSSSQALYYEPTILTEIPSPVSGESESVVPRDGEVAGPAADESTGPADGEAGTSTEGGGSEPAIVEVPGSSTERGVGGARSLLPVGGPEVSGFSYDDSLGAAWVGHVEGLFVVEVSQSATSEGSCLMLVGAVTPSSVEEDFVASGFQAPEMSVVVNGEQIRTAFDECDTSSTEAAGYGWILDAEVLVGTAYPFYAQVFLEGDSLAGLEAIIIGDPSSSQALYYEPTILTEIPAP